MAPNTSMQSPEQAPADGATPENPVIDALKTIQTWIASVGQKDPQKAQSLSTAFTAFVGSLQGGQPEGKPEGPSDQAGPSEQPPMDNQGSSKRPQTRAMPMNARPGAAQIM